MVRVFFTLAVVWVCCGATTLCAEQPEAVKKEEKLERSLEKQIKSLSAAIKADPQTVRLYSQRGDAFFFASRFKKAVADYEKMVELDPKSEPYHWRRGIAYYYAGQYDKAAAQFEMYHKIDDMDRENGIWRFLSQAKSLGIEKARGKLIRYTKDDRPPLPAVYRMFSGDISGKQIVQDIESAKIDENERHKRLFYAQLYIGLLADIEKQPKKAAEALKAAAENPWPEKVGFGPNYMWHCARLHLKQLGKKRPSGKAGGDRKS